MDKLRYEYGLELTVCAGEKRLKPFLKKYKDQNEYIGRYGWSYGSYDAVAKFLDIPRSNVKACNDEIEIASPICSTMQEIQDYYSKIIPKLREEGFPISTPAEMSGGGHLHVSMKNEKWNKKTAILAEIYRDWLNRPYLNWIFNHPNDDWNAGWWATVDEQIGNHGYKGKKNLYRFHTGKDNGLNFHTGQKTLEIRFFDAPRNWEEQRLHVLFADRWLWWLERRWRAGNRTKLKYRWPSDIQELTYDECAVDFRKLIRDIGLNPDDYEHFLRNMRDRYKYGWRRD